MQLFKVKKSNIPSKLLKDKYIVPPFSVFNTHQPYWRDRLNTWKDIGVYKQNGRAEMLSYDNRRMDKKAGKGKHTNGTSSFNPVLCEVVYKWFTPHEQSLIIDPFAGGIVRGAVASILGHIYRGFDISKEQVDSNYNLYYDLIGKYNMSGVANWLYADSSNIDKLNTDVEYDLLFTCPPYYNLEVYSDDKNDLSNQESYSDFLIKYEDIIKKSCDTLKEDSFAVIVVSEIRDKKTGEYYGFVADTIKAFQKAGLKYYNEIILYNDTGNLAIVSGDYLDRARKVGRQHQNVLVFYKGDTKHIKEKFGKFYKEN